jgi:type IV secretory pathway TraG/TraD family ATPase VirD4
MLDIVHKLKGQRKLYIINMVDPASSDKYNPFLGANPTTCKDMLINLTDWSEEHYKANTERYLERLIRLLNLAEINLTFKNILAYMPDKELKVLSAKLNKEGKITKDEHMSNLELVKTSGSIANSACARFSLIQESEIGNIFDDNGIDIYKALSEKAIILFILNPLSYPELSPLLGRLILIDSKKAVSKMFTQKIADRLFFIMDEINIYASPTLIDLINKSRSANITCIPATQSLADLEYIAGESFKNQIIENCNNYIIMRQNSAKSAEEWANIVGTKQTMEVTYQIEQSNHLTSSTGVGSARVVREYQYHPDDIKALRTGEAVYLSKDDNINAKIKVNMPF